MVKKVITLVAVLLMVGAASPAHAHDKKPQPSIVILDEVNEGTWARYPIDLSWGQSAHALYSGSEYARIHCHNEAGAVIYEGPTIYLQGEGGPGVSVDIPVPIPYMAATYAFCEAELLGKRNVIAKDSFIVYSPV